MHKQKSDGGFAGRPQHLAQLTMGASPGNLSIVRRSAAQPESCEVQEVVLVVCRVQVRGVSLCHISKSCLVSENEVTANKQAQDSYLTNQITL